jgi:hypothetical protein
MVRVSHSRLHVAYASLAFNLVFGLKTDFASVTPIDNTGKPVTISSRAYPTTVL